VSNPHRDIFTLIKWYTFETGLLIIFVVVLYKMVMYELGR